MTKGVCNVADTSTYMECLKALALKTEEIQACAAGGDWDGLLLRLEERQDLMNRVDALPQEARVLTAEERSTAGHLLDALTEQDHETTRLVSQVFAATRAEIEKGHSVRTTVTAYRKSAQYRAPGITARFVDTQR